MASRSTGTIKNASNGSLIAYKTNVTETAREMKKHGFQYLPLFAGSISNQSEIVDQTLQGPVNTF